MVREFMAMAGYECFLQTPGPPEVCDDKTPLTYEDISVYRMSGAATFNLVTWIGNGGAEYSVSAIDGVLVSTQPGGSVY